MSASPQDTPAPVAAPALLRPGFGLRLGLALSLAILLAYAIVAAMTVARDGPERYVRRADFLIVLTGAAILADGHPSQLYDEAAQAAAQGALLREVGYAPLRLLPYNHPPFEALLAAGLRAAGLSPAATFGLWTLLSLGALGAALGVLRRGWPVAGTRGRLLAGAALTFFPLTAGLLLGQSTALVLLGWAAGSVALRRGHDGWAGVALALAMLKPQAVPVLLLALLLTRRWRALAAWAATVAAAVVVTLPLLGADWPLRYAAFVLRVAAWPPSPALDPAIMQNWRGLFSHLLGDGTPATLLTAAATLLSLAVVAWLWLAPNLTPNPSPKRGGEHDPPFPAREGGGGVLTAWDRRWAGTLLIALLVDPHLLPHDLALALVPGWILAAGALAGARPRGLAWLGLGWVLGLVAVLAHDLPLAPAVLWLAITAGGLVWHAQRPVAAAEPATGVGTC